MRRFALQLALVMCLSAVSAAAQTARTFSTPLVEITGGYSLLRSETVAGSGFNLHGGSVSIAANVNNWLGFVGDFGYYRNKSISPAGFGLNVSSYTFGPRVSYRGFEHFSLFAHQLIGAAHAGGTLYTQGFASGTAAPGPVNSFAMATGGGLDYNLSRPLGIRAQGEWLYTTFPNGASSRQNYVRFTLGAVFRFGY